MYKFAYIDNLVYTYSIYALYVEIYISIYTVYKHKDHANDEDKLK